MRRFQAKKMKMKITKKLNQSWPSLWCKKSTWDPSLVPILLRKIQRNLLFSWKTIFKYPITSLSNKSLKTITSQLWQETRSSSSSTRRTRWSSKIESRQWMSMFQKILSCRIQIKGSRISLRHQKWMLHPCRRSWISHASLLPGMLTSWSFRGLRLRRTTLISLLGSMRKMRRKNRMRDSTLAQFLRALVIHSSRSISQKHPRKRITKLSQVSMYW